MPRLKMPRLVTGTRIAVASQLSLAQLRRAPEHLDKTRSILNLINQVLSSCMAKNSEAFFQV